MPWGLGVPLREIEERLRGYFKKEKYTGSNKVYKGLGLGVLGSGVFVSRVPARVALRMPDTEG